MSAAGEHETRKDEIRSKKRKKSSRNQILLLSKAAKKICLASDTGDSFPQSHQKKGESFCGLFRKGLADVSNTFNQSCSSRDSTDQSGNESRCLHETSVDLLNAKTHPAFAVSSNGTSVNSFNIGRTDSSKPIKHSTLSGHRPSRRAVKSPRFSGSFRYINSVPTLKSRNTSPLTDEKQDRTTYHSLNDTGVKHEDGTGFSYSTDYGPCFVNIESDNEQHVADNTESSTDDDEGIEGVHPLPVSEEEQSGAARASTPDSGSPDIELPRKDIQGYIGDVNCEENFGLNLTPIDKLEGINRFVDESVLVHSSPENVIDSMPFADRCEICAEFEENPVKNFSFHSDDPGSPPYFNSTLLDHKVSKNIREIPDMYDFSTIHESFEQIISETCSLDRAKRSKDLDLASIETNFGDEDDRKLDTEVTPFKQAEHQSASPRTPFKETRFRPSRKGKLMPRGSSYIYSDVKLAENEAGNGDDLENMFVYKDAGNRNKRRKLVKTKAGSPFGPTSKYPDNLLKPSRFQLVTQSTSTPVKTSEKTEWLSMDMSAVRPPSLSDGEMLVPDESRIVNSNEIHVSDVSSREQILDSSGSFDPQF